MGQSKGAPKPKARQIIISRLINEARTEVIINDIELNFLLRLKKKVEGKEICINEAYDLVKLSHDIRLRNDHFAISLEKLNYLKEMRYASKADRLAEIVESTTPSVINAKY